MPHTAPRPPRAEHPAVLPHLFAHTVDAVPVVCVRPCDTPGPTWVIYQQRNYLGTLHHHPDSGWYLQHAREHHHSLDNAIRALRRPTTWPAARARAAQWAHDALSTPGMCVINIQTTGLHHPQAVHIAICTPDSVLLDTLINPRQRIEPAATRLHHHTHRSLSDAPVFGDVLPHLAETLHGRRCVTYNLPFTQQVLHNELARITGRLRHFSTQWADAMRPVAHWTGLWSAHHRTYRNQRLHGPHEARSKCEKLIDHLSQLRAE
ncbi:3'-5' exonuclease [Streptomyces sp. NPDC091027]|uniref:3'-5' exonuclease n=1 Tax=Streptomyces sp. NPDC091027 TaxID=3365971 RepID=UPI00380A6CF8